MPFGGCLIPYVTAIPADDAPLSELLGTQIAPFAGGTRIMMTPWLCCGVPEFMHVGALRMREFFECVPDLRQFLALMQLLRVQQEDRAARRRSRQSAVRPTQGVQAVGNR
jgi:hypothetical protein